MTPKPEKTAAKVVAAETSMTGQDAIAQCPAGMVCTGGGIDVPEGAVVTASRLTGDGTGWYGAFKDGPSGHTGTVRAVCVPEKD